MGYTHYFPHTEVSEEVWSAMLKDFEKMYDAIPDHNKSLNINGYPEDKVQLACWNPDSSVSWSPCTSFKQLLDSSKDNKEFYFNGFPESLSHETFVLVQQGGEDFMFCKTANKPYDLMVCACLVIYNFHSSETIDISSDGDWDDWRDAMKFVGNVLEAEYVMKFKMGVNL